LVEKPEGKRPFELPRHRGNDSIKMNLKTAGFVGVNWIHVAEDQDQ
jgi:hypothetical protein